MTADATDRCEPAGRPAQDWPADEGPTEEAALNLVLAMHRLIRTLRRSVTSVEPRLPAGGQPTLHPTQLLVLAQLAEAGPTRVGELAARIPCSQPTATTVANGLAAAGLVERIPDEADGRAIQLQLTERGQQTITWVGREQAAFLRSRLDELEPADRAVILAAVPVLQKMARLPD